ncbi:MAG: ATP-dependent Clp protease adaptor ClpS [Bacteroidota bacterium]
MVKNNIQLEEVLEVKSKTSKINNIVLFNDDVNTFEWVINCLVSYCGHDKIQAEQCAMLVHYTGKCEVKKGSFKTLKPICDTLLEKGLTAEIN